MEVERKYLVGDDGWKRDARESFAIEQFYVAGGDDRSVRVRIRGGDRATLTMKFGGASLRRDEFEYPLPLDDARELRAFALGRRIEKTRHLVPFGKLTIEVDVFHGAHEGLVLAEIESTDDAALDDLPGWIGGEVTGDPRYYNSTLAGISGS